MPKFLVDSHLAVYIFLKELVCLMRGTGRVKQPVLMIVFIAALWLAAGTASAAETVITILGTADLHGHIFPWDYARDTVDHETGYAKIASVVKAVRAENPYTLVVDAGDTIQGSWADFFLSEELHPVIRAMNLIGYDTWTLGNHDFNFGLDVLSRAITGSEATPLVANIYRADGTRWLTPYIIKEISGIKIGLFGLITPHIPRWEAGTPAHYAGLRFSDPITEAKKVVAELQDQVDVIVLVAHLGLNPEYGLPGSSLAAVLAANPEIAVAIAGHAHAEIDGVEIGGALVVEPGRYGHLVSRIDLTFETGHGAPQLVKKEAQNISTKHYSADPEIMEALDAYHAALRAEANTIIGRASADFLPQRYLLPGIPTVLVRDTALVDLLNAAQLKYTGAQISAASLCDPHRELVAGPIRKRDIYSLYKYDNSLLVVKITGQALKDYLERTARFYNTARPGDLTVSFNKNIRVYNYDLFAGIDYEIDISRPVGGRIVKLEYNGEPVGADQEYTLAISNYRFSQLVAAGILQAEDLLFDAYTAWGEAGRIRNLIIRYIQEQGVLEPAVDNNWRIVGVDPNHPLQAEAYAQVSAGELSLPRSVEGLNLTALNVYELMRAGRLPYQALTILHTNEIGDLLAAQTVWADLERYRQVADRSLVLGLGGGPDNLVNLFGYDALAVGGNRFFQQIADWLELDRRTDFPVLGANLYTDNSSLFARYLIKEVGGIYVGIFGLAARETGIEPNPTDDMRLTVADPLVTARRIVAELTGKADVVIALIDAHGNGAGAVTAKDLAEQVPGIDLIIAGDGRTAGMGGLLGETLIVPAGGPARGLGVAELLLQHGRITGRYVLSREDEPVVVGMGERNSQPVRQGKAEDTAKKYTIITNGFRVGGGTGVTKYQIQPGDTLSEIAQRLGVRLTDLVELNSISNPDLIYADRFLLVPVD